MIQTTWHSATDSNLFLLSVAGLAATKCRNARHLATTCPKPSAVVWKRSSLLVKAKASSVNVIKPLGSTGKSTAHFHFLRVASSLCMVTSLLWGLQLLAVARSAVERIACRGGSALPRIGDNPRDGLEEQPVPNIVRPSLVISSQEHCARICRTQV